MTLWIDCVIFVRRLTTIGELILKSQKRLRHLSLFTGGGGGELGVKLLGWETLGYVENNEYCQKVIAQRIKDGVFDDAPIFGDIRAFVSDGYAEAYQGMVDVVSAGFPCQPFSVAGKQAAEDDPRNRWPATLDVIRAVRPRFCFLENVPGLLAGSHGYFGRILGQLAESGYDARWRVLSAAEVGGPHKRDRLWILAYTASAGLSVGGRSGLETSNQETGTRVESRLERSGEYRGRVLGDNQGFGIQGNGFSGKFKSDSYAREEVFVRSGGGTGELVNDSGEGSGGLQVRSRGQVQEATDTDGRGPWCDAEYVECSDGKYRAVKPGVRLLVDGYPGRVDEIRTIGNGQVPAVVATAWDLLSEGLGL